MIITLFIKGMGKRDDEFIIILDINKVFSTDEIAMVQDAGHDTEVPEVNDESSNIKTVVLTNI
jgi:purine-binding chemotaxis protein CheW